jgi:hypothetical protein
LGLGDQKTKWVNAPIPHEGTVGPYPVKGQAALQVMAPWGCLKMPQGR